MTLRSCFLVFCACLAWFAGSPVAAQAVSENEELTLGVKAYKNNRFEEAKDHFEKAVAHDPTNVNAHLYLATVHMQVYVPGVEVPENVAEGAKAIEQYKAVLNLAAGKTETLNALKGIAYLFLQMKKFDDAKEYYRKATEIDTEDPESYYSIGVIAWTKTYQPRMEERANLGLKPEASLPTSSPGVCGMIRTKNWDTVQEGMENLIKAIQLRPDYDDAMAYLNLMYRERADLQCDDPSAHKADLLAADEWVDKTMAVKKAKAEKQQASPSNPNQ